MGRVHYHINIDIKNYYQNISKKQYGNALNYYNEGIFLYNEYIEYKNRYYLPYKSDDEIKQMLENINDTFSLSLIQLKKIEDIPLYLDKSIKQLERLVQQAKNDLAYQKDNLEKYLIISKNYRETLSNPREN